MKRELAGILAVLFFLAAGCTAQKPNEAEVATTVAETAATESTAQGTQADVPAETTKAETTASSTKEPEESRPSSVSKTGEIVTGTTATATQKTAESEKPASSVTTVKATKAKTTSAVKTTVKTTAKTTADKASQSAVTLLQPEDGAVLESQAPLIEYYLALDNDNDAALFWNASYYGMAHSASFTAKWRSQGRLWHVYVSTNPNFDQAEEIITMKTSVTVANLLPGTTYYWKVVTAAGEESEVRRVTAEPTLVRWIDADGGDNIRDLGGWKTESGKQVRYELLYRGAAIDGYNGGPALTSDGKDIFSCQLGIRTEIDLRGSDSASKSSPFGGTYVKATITQYDYIFDDEQSKESIGTIFKLLSRESTYPVYFHCNAGADRTGTLAFLINGLLGVSHEDLTRDFELTGFAERGKRLRSAIDTETLMFKPNGIMQRDGGNYVAWGPLYHTVMSTYGTENGKLSEAIAAFLKTECGVTQEEIEAVRRILLTDANQK